MKPAPLKDIKASLKELDSNELSAIILRIAKYKKENKELLSYLLFNAESEQLFIQQVNEEVDELMAEVNHKNVYWAKKTIRKILRLVNKYIKFSAVNTTKIELLIHFCKALLKTGISLHPNTIIGKMYRRQIDIIVAAVDKLHEDLRYDYVSDIEELNEQL